VAGLDVFELKRVIRDRLWPENDLREVQAFATRETTTQVSVRKAKEMKDE
jgi:hypothetical protein